MPGPAVLSEGSAGCVRLLSPVHQGDVPSEPGDRAHTVSPCWSVEPQHSSCSFTVTHPPQRSTEESTPCCSTAGTRLLVVRVFPNCFSIMHCSRHPPFFPSPADIKATRGASIELSVFCLNLRCCSCSYFAGMMQQLEARQANGGITSARMAFEFCKEKCCLDIFP